MGTVDYNKVDIADEMIYCPYRVPDEYYYRQLLKVNVFDDKHLAFWRKRVNIYAWICLITPIVFLIAIYLFIGVFFVGRGWGYIPFLEEIIGIVLMLGLIFILGVIPIAFLAFISADVLKYSPPANYNKARNFSWTFRAKYLGHKIVRAPLSIGSKDALGRPTGKLIKVQYEDINGDTYVALSSLVNAPILEQMSPGDMIRVSRIYGHVGKNCDFVLIPYFTNVAYRLVEREKEREDNETLARLSSMTL